MSKNLYVGNLASTINEDKLHEMFTSCGKVKRTKLVTDWDTGQSKGFGFVEMHNEEEAKTAIEKFNGAEIDGRKLKVNEARPRSNNMGRGGQGADQKRSRFPRF